MTALHTAAREALGKARELILEDCAALVACHTHPVSGKMDDEAAVAARARYHEALAMIDAALDAGQAQPVALQPTDIYDFAAWLTTRPGVMEVGSSKEAGPMAEAVGEYLRTFPERFAAPQASQPVPEWDEVCVLGHCNSPSGCERDGACRANLGAQASQPVAPAVWINPRSLEWLQENPAHRVLQTELRGVPVQGWTALSAAPPAPAAQPLTDEQIDDLWNEHMVWGDQRRGGHQDFKAAIRAAIAEFCRINGIGAQP